MSSLAWLQIRATSAQKEKKGKGAVDRDWAHVTSNQDFNGVDSTSVATDHGSVQQWFGSVLNQF